MPNKKKIFNTIITVLLTLGFSISLQSLLASWTAPTDIAPANNAATPVNVSSIGQSKNAGLILNAGNINANGLVVTSGRTALNNSAPEATLDVNGDVKIGNSDVLCLTANEGSIRYNSITKNIEYCDGVNWGEFSHMDGDPAQFNFTDLTNQELNTTVVSDVITPINYQRSIVSVTGSGTPKISCNASTTWVTSCLLYDGQKLQVKQTSSNDYLATTSATITMGAISTTWKVKTRSFAKLNCKAWYDSGSTADGIYWIDPDGSGPIEQQQLYCKMAGQWALVVGIELNTKHMNADAVAGNLTDPVNTTGKVSDIFINAIRLAGSNQFALEAIPGFAHAPAAPVGFSSGQAWLFSNCTFSASLVMSTVPGSYPGCINSAGSWYGNSARGMGYDYSNSWGGFYGVPGTNGIYEAWVSDNYRHYPGRLWVR